MRSRFSYRALGMGGTLVPRQVPVVSSRRSDRRAWRGRRAKGMLVARSRPTAAPGAAGARRTGRAAPDAALGHPSRGRCPGGVGGYPLRMIGRRPGAPATAALLIAPSAHAALLKGTVTGSPYVASPTATAVPVTFSKQTAQ